MVMSFYLIRLAADDDDFILDLVPRFVDFPLPPWRKAKASAAGIARQLRRHLEEDSLHSAIYVAENDAGERVGFIHLQKTQDFFTDQPNAHICDLAVAPAHERRGVARALLQHAEHWAREHRCQLLTLAVLPGNTRALALYQSAGFGMDLLRMAKPVAATLPSEGR